MLRIAPVLVAVALAAGAARAAAPEPVESRAGALSELRAAIADEQRALELLRKDPPRYDTAALRLRDSRDRLANVRGYLSGVPGAAVAEAMVDEAWHTDVRARDATWRLEAEKAIALIGAGLAIKRAAVRRVPPAAAPATSAQCSDGKDNDGDGITDWTLEPGCTSSRDVRESTRFSCAVESATVSGRLALTGSCSGTFSEVEFTLLDGLQLNGRFDIKHAPSCSPPTVTRVSCTTKDGAQNPGRLVDARFATTARQPGQRVQLRFFDIRKRQIARFVVPVR